MDALLEFALSELNGVELVMRSGQPSAYFHHLMKIDFAVIGHLDWSEVYMRRRDRDGARARLKDFNILLRRACFIVGLPDDKLVWYFKNENAPSHGHAHFLLGKVGLKDVSPRLMADVLSYLWSHGSKVQEFGAKGRSVIDVFDVARKERAVSYITKPEFDAFGNEADAFDCASKGMKRLILTGESEVK